MAAHTTKYLPLSLPHHLIDQTMQRSRTALIHYFVHLHCTDRTNIIATQAQTAIIEQHKKQPISDTF